MNVLVVVACGAKKIWDVDRTAGATPATKAYVGTLFRLSRVYAERFADSWVILSAKYGFAEPGFVIPANYDVSFNKKSTNPVQVDILRSQIRQMHLDRFDQVIVLGGKRYVKIVEESFAACSNAVLAPLKGLGIGMMQSRLKQSVEKGIPLGSTTMKAKGAS